MASPAVKRFTKQYGPVADAVSRLDIAQVDREKVADALTEAFTAGDEHGRTVHPNFMADTFRLIASDPLCACAGPSPEDFKTPCPFGREIRIGMHLSSAPDGRSQAWRDRKPVVRCVTCGSAGTRLAAAQKAGGVPLRELLWKNEDEIDGVPIGPLWSRYDDGSMTGGSWQSKPTALALARERGVELVEV